MSEGEKLLMSINDATHLVEAHVGSIMRETGLDRLEAVLITRRHSVEVGKRLGLEPARVRSIACSLVVQAVQ